MKEGSYEEIQYGDETFRIDKSTGKIETNYIMKDSQGRRKEQYEDSAKMIAYSLLGLAGIIIVLMIIM